MAHQPVVHIHPGKLHPIGIGGDAHHFGREAFQHHVHHDPSVFQPAKFQRMVVVHKQHPGVMDFLQRLFKIPEKIVKHIRGAVAVRHHAKADVLGAVELMFFNQPFHAV